MTQSKQGYSPLQIEILTGMLRGQKLTQWFDDEGSYWTLGKENVDGGTCRSLKVAIPYPLVKLDPMGPNDKTFGEYVLTQAGIYAAIHQGEAAL